MSKGKIITEQVSKCDKDRYEEIIHQNMNNTRLISYTITSDDYSVSRHGIITKISSKRNSHLVNNIYFQKSKNKWKAEIYNKKTRKVTVIGRFQTRRLASNSLKQYRKDGNI